MSRLGWRNHKRRKMGMFKRFLIIISLFVFLIAW